jgi:polyhydroxybutyrate depolymerase
MERRADMSRLRFHNEEGRMVEKYKTKMLVSTTIITCLFLSSLVSVIKANNGPVYITGVTPVPSFFKVPFLTPWNDALAVLPQTTTITLSNDSVVPVTLNWATVVPYLPYAYGNYTAIGTFELPEGVSQPDPPIPLQVTTILRIESGRELMKLEWEGFNQPGTYVAAWMIVNGVNRTYYYYIPTSYDGSKPVPLVFDIHGGGSNGLAQWSSSRFDRFAEKEGFICVAPNARAGIWTADDVAFFSAMIDRMTEEYNIDTRRIYACGISNGGMMTTYLAYNLSDRIAAVGLLSGWVPSLLGALPRPMTVIMFGGSEESTTGPPFRNLVPSMLTIADALVDQLHCDQEPEITEWPSTAELDLDNLPYWMTAEDAELLHSVHPTSVTRYAWSGGIYGTEVIVYAVWGGGHGWPGGTQYVVPTTVGWMTYLIDATELLWEHFKKHALPEQVSIDVKPGSCPNSVNLKSNGVIPVAILTTSSFDATKVDPETVRFGREGWEAKPVHYALEDVDNDGDIDMILHFRTQETGIQPGDTTAKLTGRSFYGTDTIRIVPP